MADATRCDPERFRIVHFSVQSNLLHLIVEAADAPALSAGVRSLMIRAARLVNRLLFRAGPFWADRWHGRALTSPREVRHALLYVLANSRKHASIPRLGIDPYSSGAYFDGWRDWSPRSGAAPPFAELPPVAADVAVVPVLPARTWLLTEGFRRAGLLGLGECPAS